MCRIHTKPLYETFTNSKLNPEHPPKCFRKRFFLKCPGLVRNFTRVALICVIAANFHSLCFCFRDKKKPMSLAYVLYLCQESYIKINGMAASLRKERTGQIRVQNVSNEKKERNNIKNGLRESFNAFFYLSKFWLKRFWFCLCLWL